MDKNIPSVPNKYASKKIIIFLYGIAVFLVLTISLLPRITYNDSWNDAYLLIDSSKKVSNPIESSKLLDSGGKGLLKSLHEHPYHGRLHLMVGYYYFLKGNMDSTIYHEIKALEVGSGGYVNSIEHQARGLLAEATIKRGFELTNLGDTNSAIKLYSNSIKYVPNDANVNMNLAIFYLNSKMPDSAIPYYKAANQLKKNDKAALMDLAKCYYIKKMTDSVEFYANEVLKLEPSNADAINILKFIKR
jgi:tetratricopeptide (TPR) repeat protein